MDEKDLPKTTQSEREARRSDVIARMRSDRSWKEAFSPREKSAADHWLERKIKGLEAFSAEPIPPLPPPPEPEPAKPPPLWTRKLDLD